MMILSGRDGRAMSVQVRADGRPGSVRKRGVSAPLGAADLDDHGVAHIEGSFVSVGVRGRNGLPAPLATGTDDRDQADDGGGCAETLDDELVLHGDSSGLWM
jgi:hypothetical protein